MTFIVSYEVCGFLFLIVAAVHFFSRYQLPSLQNKFFGMFIICGMLDNALDVVGALAINAGHGVPYWQLMLVNSLFYFFQILLPALLFLYILCITNTLVRRAKTEISISMIPLALAEAGIIPNIWYGNYFYFDSALAYHHGAWYATLFVGMGFYFILTLIYLLKYRPRLRSSQFLTIIVFIGLILLSSALQAIFTKYLFTGTAISLSICMMYLTLQNPAEMLDDMTGLFNRSCFLRYLSDAFQRGSTRHSLVVVALDDMRALNSVLGASVGNDVMIEVARFLKSSPRRVQAFRLLGDQFVLTCSDKTSCMDAVRVITDRFTRPWHVQDMDIRLTACVCYAPDVELGGVRGDIPMVLEYAVESAKAGGRGTLLEFGAASIARLQRRRAIESSLAEAIDAERLDVYFQPICSPDGRLHSAEALVRFRHEDMGMIPPDEFIPLAEKNGLIIKIGVLVLKKVCAYINEAGLLHKPGFESIEMNLSAVELMQPDLPKKLLAVMDSYGVPPSFFNFEITETTATVSGATIRDSMDALRACGARFALDDFGTGYANLDSVVKLPFSAVKLDRSMLVASASDSRSALVLEHTVKLIQSLGLEAVVEGAETAEDVNLLSRFGADYIQGYYFSRPLPAPDFTAYMYKKACAPA